MARHKNWIEFWWAILQHFGDECYRTWKSEVVAALAGGFAGAMTDYLRSHGHASFLDALINGTVGAGIVFVLYAIANLVRSPWVEHSSERSGTRRQGAGGAIILLVVIASICAALALVGGDLRSRITLSTPVDPGGKKAAELIELETCKANYAALTKPEPKDSLRRRTLRLVNELYIFWSQRVSPPPQPVPTPSTDEERKRGTAWDAYWRGINIAYKSKDFNGQILEIVREYKNKGVAIGFIEATAEQPDRLIGGPPFGGYALDNCVQYANELCQLRELTFHVTADDQRVNLPDF